VLADDEGRQEDGFSVNTVNDLDLTEKEKAFIEAISVVVSQQTGIYFLLLSSTTIHKDKKTGSLPFHLPKRIPKPSPPFCSQLFPIIIRVKLK